jgi:hypothetical protein
VAFGRSDERDLIDQDDFAHEIALDLDLGFRLTIYNHSSQDERLVPTSYAVVGRRVLIRLETTVDSEIGAYSWRQHRDAQITPLGKEAELVFARAGRLVIEATIAENRQQPAQASSLLEIAVSESDVQRIGGHIRVTMDRTPADPTLDQALWVAIRNRTHAISFERYREFLGRIFQAGEPGDLAEHASRRLREYGHRGHGIGAYQVLKYLTEVFLLLECGVRISHHHHHHHHPIDPDEETKRLGRSYSFDEVERKLKEYLGQPPQLPTSHACCKQRIQILSALSAETTGC